MYFWESNCRGAGKRHISNFPEDRPIGPGSRGCRPGNPCVPVGITPIEFAITGENLFESHGIEDARQIGLEGSTMNTLRVVRNILGTAGLLFAGYVFLTSIRDTRRYLKIRAM